jgi:hypothetical protein
MKGSLNFDNEDELEQLKERIIKALSPIKPAEKNTPADKNFLFSAQRTEAGRQLPPYYLVYFLLVDLLGFKNLGQFEKIAWSIPIDFDGRAFLIEHRKFGLGVFAHDAEKENKDAAEIVKRIKKAVKMASPYFEFVAVQAAKDSKLNVKNNSRELFDRYKFFAEDFLSISKEAEDRKKERIVERTEHENGHSEIITYPSWELRKKSKWMAMSAIDAFFSWTEHIFIHLAILNGEILTGEEVADLAESDWQTKFKKAVSLDSSEMKRMYDELTELKRQLRNYIAHGAFGKRGEAFSFHSSVGAVPLLLPHQKGKPRFSFSSNLAFDEHKAINTIEKFVETLWKGEREPAKLYIQESDLPLILTYAADGTYQKAMNSAKDMEEFVDYLHAQWERAANMDF